MRVLGLLWVGVRTDRFDETVGFFRDALGVPMDVPASDFGWARMPRLLGLEFASAAQCAKPR